MSLCSLLSKKSEGKGEKKYLEVSIFQTFPKLFLLHSFDLVKMIMTIFWLFLCTIFYRIRSAYHHPAKMNMVKRIMGRPRQEECSPQDNALGLMHLRRLFTELCHPPRHMTQKEQEEKLYMMLPVFNRVSLRLWASMAIQESED